jgi:transposase
MPTSAGRDAFQVWNIGRFFAGLEAHADTYHGRSPPTSGNLWKIRISCPSNGGRRNVEFITEHGSVGGVVVEGPGTCGAELTKVLGRAGMSVIAVNRLSARNVA